VVVVVVVMMVVVMSGRQRCELAGAGRDGGRIDHAAFVKHSRQRALPALVVGVCVSSGDAGRPARDLVDQVRAEVGPGELLPSNLAINF
jgi:hypothetical protein